MDLLLVRPFGEMIKCFTGPFCSEQSGRITGNANTKGMFLVFYGNSVLLHQLHW
jgi:hypothetical protein